ncbi:MAG: hypothetical protein ACFE85_04305 [Candidatus Hodarchaeota archaeon]
MNIEEKKIFFLLSPHINYYHSYRGDSRGVSGFGKDIKMMSDILDELDKIEDRSFRFGDMRISWDYGDTFWSMQLQKEYQPEILDRVIDRCKKGKDEVLIGSWGNCAPSILDTEEYIQQHNWFLENSMGIGVNQLFPGRIAPYVRTQETMFTQGMIELFYKLGIEGIGLYYSRYGFDAARPFINPRLTLNQSYGVVKFKSTISEASCLMIPMYAFGDILDFCSIKRWFEFIRNKQESGEIKGHACIWLNYDMDYSGWIGMKLPKIAQWMPNSRGLMEFAEAVDKYEYVEFGNLLDVIPKLEVQGETYLREDVADGIWNGYYNWAQKYNNTQFWTIAQRARWLKSISDTLMSVSLVKDSVDDINNYLRKDDDSEETYIKNKILFASTTNFGMAMPFLHPHRRKTAISYGLKAFSAAVKAIEFTIPEAIQKLKNNYKELSSFLIITPILNRGMSEKEILTISTPILVRSEIPPDLIDKMGIKKNNSELINLFSDKIVEDCGIYQYNSNFTLEALIPPSEFNQSEYKTALLSFKAKESLKTRKLEKLAATKNSIKNQLIALNFNDNGKVSSFKFNDIEFACPNFLNTAVTFGKEKNSKKDEIEVLRDGKDGFSASVKIRGEFEIIKNCKVKFEKIITLYTGIPHLFVRVSMDIPDIRGEATTRRGEDGSTYFIEEKYDMRWQEIMPCEIRPNLIGINKPLKIWKKNFLGVVDYFNLDMKEVDPKNADIDCLVANISDGWMGLSNHEKGITIGFNSLESANFAFSPIKLKDKGFKDIKTKGQQIRINPFGTYYGKILHYWTDGNGHAQKVTKNLIETNYSTAPTFSGRRMSFELVISPFLGEYPPEAIQCFIDHISLMPLVLIGTKKNGIIHNNYKKYIELTEKLKQEYQVENLMEISYIDWVREVNKNFDPKVPETFSTKKSGIPISVILRMLIDGIKGR